MIQSLFTMPSQTTMASRWPSSIMTEEPQKKLSGGGYPLPTRIGVIWGESPSLDNAIR